MSSFGKPEKSPPLLSTVSPAAVAFGGMLAMAAALGIGRFVYTPILPFMLEELGLSKAEGGVIASANFFGYLVGALAAAKAGLPGSRRAWLLGALAVSAITTGAMGGVASLPLFAGLRFVGGFASAIVLVFSAVLVLQRLAEAGRPGLSALHFGGVGLGIAFSSLLVTGLVAGGHGWRIQWAMAGAACLLALFAVMWLVPSGGATTPAAPKREPDGGRVGLRLPLLIGAYGLFGFGYVITATFISTMVRGAPELRSIEPAVWLVVGLAAMPSVALWGWVGRRWGNHRGFAVACLVEAGGVALSVATVSTAAVLGAAVFLGGTFMGLTALGLIHAREISGGDPRRSMALMTAAFGLGQMIGPAFAGWAYDLTGSLRLPTLVAAAGLLAAAGLVLVGGLLAAGKPGPLGGQK